MTDFVFPYVDNSDPVWIEEFRFFCKRRGIEFNEPSRFRDWGLLKYVFRSISLNMPFIRKLHFLVASESQVPNWVNRDNVHVVVHKEFIPQKYLPTFNSTCIEMFLKEIPDLAEQFIYSNDDIYAMLPIKEEDFFKGGLPQVALYLKNRTDINSQFRRVVARCSDLITRDLGVYVDSSKYWRPPHYMTPMKKSTHKTVWSHHRSAILDSISPLREEKNYNQYIFTLYQVLSGKSTYKNVTGMYRDFYGFKEESIIEAIRSPSTKMLCVNDNEYAPNAVGNILEQEFLKKFPYRCKYEKKV